ncbi:MAG: glutaredoxin domain-containing protein [Candidatus Diapherotrites archaeon]|nr:glutaredoxin domain-containing protein [Candidatus Diapherotrites archaeon]
MSNVLIYTTNTCSYCVMAKDFFKQNNVSYVEVNVSNDPRKADEMIEKSGQTGVPVIDINGKIIIGFDKRAIKEALNLQ